MRERDRETGHLEKENVGEEMRKGEKIGWETRQVGRNGRRLEGRRDGRGEDWRGDEKMGGEKRNKSCLTSYMSQT